MTTLSKLQLPQVLLYTAPVVSTQFVPVAALTRRTAKLALLSAPEIPVRSATIWLFQPVVPLLVKITYEPTTMPLVGLLLLATTPRVPPDVIGALNQIVPSVVY